MYIVNLSKGTAIEPYNGKNGSLKIRNFAIFIDDKGAYILKRKEKVYLNENNSKFN